MPAEWVVDASVAAAYLFDERHSEIARRFLRQAVEDAAVLVAPELILLEVASIAAKKVWLSEASEADGAAAVAAVSRLIGRPVPTDELAPRAYALAAAHRFSAYDAAYLALAEVRDCQTATLDGRLARRAEQAGLAHLVHALT